VKEVAFAQQKTEGVVAHNDYYSLFGLAVLSVATSIRLISKQSSINDLPSVSVM